MRSEKCSKMTGFRGCRATYEQENSGCVEDDLFQNLVGFW